MILSEVLIDEKEIRKRVEDLGKRIGADYAGKDLVVIGILKGAVVFLSDLVRCIDRDVGVTLDFMAVSSYGDSTNTSGIVRIIKDLDCSIRGKACLIVEDIVDTG
jgi:hypoxanthine phosphoribosyltransferase